MCGITGFVDLRIAREEPEHVLRNMSDRLASRGPDARGAWIDKDAGIFLGHRRLAVIDLSPAGAQPMQSADGRWIISYNGELYNAEELRRSLSVEGLIMRGASDTEVLLEGIARWGLFDMLLRVNGMFAFAIWDRAERTLFLVRDRLGIKPLYWGQMNGVFLFASELSAINEHPAWHPTIDREAATLFMRYGYIPAPRTIWQQACKLEPGKCLIYKVGAVPEIKTYWSMSEVQGVTSDNVWFDSPQAAVADLDELLRNAVARQMVSDVPLGAFLSGGIDSSLVVALMQAQSMQPVATFSIGFNEDGYNEAQHAKAVAQHLGTSHQELYVEPRDALDVLPTVSALFDEPFSDSSQIPTYLVSHLARGHVTVALSGDGGDECFAGYSRYSLGQQMWQEVSRFPHRSRQIASAVLRSVPENAWNRIATVLPVPLRPVSLGTRVHRWARRLRSASATEIYSSLLSQWHRPDQLIVGADEPPSVAQQSELEKRIPSMLDRMQYIDTVTYLPDDILTKVDRATMGVSLECRVPLLDHRVVESAWKIPASIREFDGRGKWPLRQVLYRYVPSDLLDRPKMGFGVPIDSWLRGPLKEWAWSLLSPEALARHGVLQVGQVQAAWKAHQSGKQDLQYPLWTVLMLQDWLERNASRSL